ncbi:MAG: hypothetical protein H6739_02585 [Alphaproteobacteria bacterium]|nr:hypothetical protein [Alphaproteobacteria bacterium]
MRAHLIIIPLLVGCGPDTVIEGSVAGKALDEPGTLFWGGPFVILADRDLTCMDVAFARSTYSAGVSPTDFDFVGLQFHFNDAEVFEGVFSVVGDAPVHAKALVVEGGAFIDYVARSGTLEIDTWDDRGTIEGKFDVGFGDEGSWSAEFFDAEWCLNLER